MTESTGYDFFTDQHERLASIASWANFFAWLVLFVNIFLMIASFIDSIYIYAIREPDYFEVLSQDSVYMARFTLNLFSILLRGVVYWFVLKGVSLGLNMIIETDVNYRKQVQGGSHEQ
jgi:hypothetical protein